MEFLLDLNISEITIELLDDIYSDVEKEEIITCQNEITSSIKYLRNIGIKDNVIEEILIDDYHFLTPGEFYLKKAVSKVDQKSLVIALNENLDYAFYLKDFL